MVATTSFGVKPYFISFLVIAVLAKMVAVTKQAFVVAEPDTVLLRHGCCGLLSACLGVVYDFELARVRLV